MANNAFDGVRNPFAPDVFQQPQSQILSPSTLQAGTLQSGTPFDIISQFVAGEEARKSDAARQQALEQAAIIKAVGERQARDLEATQRAETLGREDVEITRKQGNIEDAAKARVTAAKLAVKDAQAAATALRKGKIEAAKAKPSKPAKDFFASAANQKLASGMARAFFPDANIIEDAGGNIQIKFAKAGDEEKWVKMSARAQELAVEAGDTVSPNMASYLLQAREEVQQGEEEPAPAAGDGGEAAPATISTEAEYNALAPNTPYIWGPTGQAGTKE